MSQSVPAEPIVTSSDKVDDLPDDLAEPSPPLGELAAAIREYVSAVRLGEDKDRRLDLSRRVWELCWTCRPKHGERDMRFTNGMLAHVVLDYSTTHVKWIDRRGHVLSDSSRGRRHANKPSELDRELDRIEDEMTRAGHEAAYGKRMPDENGRPLPAPATDRLLAIADRIEQQQSKGAEQVRPTPVSDGGGSAAVDDEARLSPTELADRFDVPQDALRQRLDGWRKKHHEGWYEVADRKPREAQYIYRVGSVRHIIEQMQATSQLTSE